MEKKTLLSIEHLHEGVCAAVADVESELDAQRLSASLLTLMTKDKLVARAVCGAANLFITHHALSCEVADKSIDAVKKHQS